MQSGVRLYLVCCYGTSPQSQAIPPRTVHRAGFLIFFRASALTLTRIASRNSYVHHHSSGGTAQGGDTNATSIDDEIIDGAMHPYGRRGGAVVCVRYVRRRLDIST